MDEVVLRRLAADFGGQFYAVYGKHGKGDLRRQARRYNEAARFGPWVLLVDLNHEFRCAPELRRSWIPDPAPQMCFRVAVHEIESWLLADKENLSRFLNAPKGRIPIDPESVPDPKQLMVDIANRSRSRRIREDMVPRPGSGRSVGPAYTSRLIEFVMTRWRPAVAELSSAGLLRCRLRLGAACQPAGPQGIAPP